MGNLVDFVEVKERCSIVDAVRAPWIEDDGRTKTIAGAVPGLWKRRPPGPRSHPAVDYMVRSRNG
jgi:hypothetical protein